jgi:hypothetical protein
MKAKLELAGLSPESLRQINEIMGASAAEMAANGEQPGEA